MVKRWGKRIGISTILILLFVAFPLVFPKPLFAYGVVDGSLSVYSDRPIPQDKALQLLQQVNEKLEKSPIPYTASPMQIYIVNTTWRWRWLWIVPNRVAGGFIAPPATRQHTFFSGADFETDELISPSGYRTQPPRTLSYFGAHELTHVMTNNSVGVIRYHQMPTWVVEGLADYVAMERESSAELYAKIGEQDADLAMMQAYGVYAPYRLLVTYFLDDSGWTIEQLLATDLSLEEARTIVFTELR